jgi:hypothetical protein
LQTVLSVACQAASVGQRRRCRRCGQGSLRGRVTASRRSTTWSSCQR